MVRRCRTKWVIRIRIIWSRITIRIVIKRSRIIAIIIIYRRGSIIVVWWRGVIIISWWCIKIVWGWSIKIVWGWCIKIVWWWWCTNIIVGRGWGVVVVCWRRRNVAIASIIWRGYIIIIIWSRCIIIIRRRIIRRWGIISSIRCRISKIIVVIEILIRRWNKYWGIIESLCLSDYYFFIAMSVVMVMTMMMTRANNYFFHNGGGISLLIGRNIDITSIGRSTWRIHILRWIVWYSIISWGKGWNKRNIWRSIWREVIWGWHKRCINLSLEM